MTHIIAVFNQKGGVGKTTTAVNLAVGAAKFRKECYNLLVDLDPQANATTSLGLYPAPGISKLLLGEQPGEAIGSPAPYSWAETLYTIRAWGMTAGESFVNLIPSNQSLVKAKERLGQDPEGRYALVHTLVKAVGVYHHVFLDLAPSMDILHEAALIACDSVLIVTRLDHLALEGVVAAFRTLKDLKDRGLAQPSIMGILPTFWDRTTNETHRQMERLADAFSDLLWPPIPVDVKAREAPAHGLSLWDYSPNSRALKGAEIRGKMVGGYERAVAELLRRTTY